MKTRVHALTLSGLSLAATALLAACNTPETGAGIAPPPAAATPPASAPEAIAPSGDPRAPIGALPLGETVARAELRPTQGNTAMGRVSFVRAGDTVTMQVALMGLAPGPHGIHVHENGDCSAPDASSAGQHFNPDERPHGGLESPPAERHPGDLGNITAKDTGEVEESISSETLLADGEFAMLGKALVVHEGVDDERTQPSGDSGDAAACGVIVAAPPAPSVHLG